MITQIILNLDLTETRKRKIAYDLGRYDDDLPDETECKDWMYEQLIHRLDELPEGF